MHRQKNAKILLMGILFCAVLFITACTGFRKMTIDTRMEMDENFQGQRVMTTILSSSIFDQAFGGDLERLQDMVTEYCPTTMQCTASEADGDVQITMTLPFANYTDYENKIGQILERTPGIYFDYSNSMFKSGFMLQEDFTSLDLFQWLLQALANEYSGLADRSLEDIFTLGDTEVVFDGGEALASQQPITVEQMESHAFDSISADITIHDNAYEVEVNFFVDSDTYYSMGDRMDAVMQRLAPAGATYNASTSDSQRIYTFGFSAYNEESLIEQLNTVFSTENCEFEVTDEGNNEQTLEARRDLTIYLDGSYFLDFSEPDTTMTYHLTADSRYSFENCESLTGFLRNFTTEQEGDTSSAYIVVGPSDRVQVEMSYSIDIRQIQAETIINGDNSLERNLIFSLGASEAEIVGDSFSTKVQGRISDGMSFETEEQDEQVLYKVHITAQSPEELSTLTTRFLNGGDTENQTSILTGGREERHRLRTISYAYEDTINLEGFLGGAVSEEGITYRITYPRQYTAALTEGTFTDVQADGNVLSLTTLNPVLTVKSEASAANIVGITQIILWWASLVLMLIGLVLNLRHIVGLWKEKEAYLGRVDLFTKKNMAGMTVCVVAVVIFVITSLRMIFRIY